MDYFVFTENEQRGPYTKNQLEGMWSAGKFTSDSLYWSEGMAEWQLLKDFVETSNGNTTFRSIGILVKNLIKAWLNLQEKFDEFSETVHGKMPPIPGAAVIRAIPKSIRYVASFILLLLVLVFAFLWMGEFDFAHPLTFTRPNTETYRAEGLDLRDRMPLIESAATWAKGDVRNGLKVGMIDLKVPTNSELDALALHRWNVLRFSEDWSKIELSSGVDQNAAKLFWISSYKKVLIKELKPLIEADQRKRAPAF